MKAVVRGRPVFNGLAWVAAALLTACASEPIERAILLPAEGSAPLGGLVISAGTAQAVIETPYAQVTTDREGKLTQGQMDPAELAQRYGSLLAARPPLPRTWSLGFEAGGERLNAISTALVSDILKALAERPAGDLVLVGHTDSVGKLESNDQLSLRRASALRDELVRQGVATNRISVAGRGERALLVPTADEVDEPRNRRVDVTLR